MLCCLRLQKKSERAAAKGDAVAAEEASTAALSIETADGKTVPADNCVFMCGFCEQIFSTSELVNEHIVRHNVNEYGELVGDDGAATGGGAASSSGGAAASVKTEPENNSSSTAETADVNDVITYSRPIEPLGSPVHVDASEISPEELAVLEQAEQVAEEAKDVAMAEGLEEAELVYEHGDNTFVVKVEK